MTCSNALDWCGCRSYAVGPTLAMDQRTKRRINVRAFVCRPYQITLCRGERLGICLIVSETCRRARRQLNTRSLRWRRLVIGISPRIDCVAPGIFQFALYLLGNALDLERRIAGYFACR